MSYYVRAHFDTATRPHTHHPTLFPAHSLSPEEDKPRPIPTIGFAVGTTLYFTGPSFKASPRNWLVHGAQGVVVGPATSTAVEGNGVAVQFPKNETACECFLHELSCEPPAEGLG